MMIAAHRLTRVALVPIAALCLTLAPRAAGAQQRENPTALLVLVRSLPPGAGVVVQRGQAPGRNLILVTDSTSVGDVAAALAVLTNSRQRHGESPDSPLVSRIPPGQPAPGAQAAADISRELERLRSANPRQVEGIGRVRAIVIPLQPLTREENR
ncbi:MAG TPA: hypothetical protein VNL98_11705 [Gemmatimonadales bacterium]|nr:hypothetical protein [Gemmatimonadales bacterium]